MIPQSHSRARIGVAHGCRPGVGAISTGEGYPMIKSFRGSHRSAKEAWQVLLPGPSMLWMRTYSLASAVTPRSCSTMAL